MPTCLDEIGMSKDSYKQFEPPALTSILKWWWVRVLPPPGTLIWRFPGFIRPRCTAGATHKAAESYQGSKCMSPTLHSPSGSLFPVVQISKVSIFPSYGLGCHNKPVCSLLRDGSRDPQSSHFGKQCGSF